MSKFLTILFLTAIWVVLQESYSYQTIIIGLVLSVAGVIFVQRFVPLPEISGIRPFWLIIYPFYLLWLLYIADFAVVKTIFSKPHVEVVKIKTKLHNSALRMILVNSITLVPGSLSLDIVDDEITVLWLGEKSALPDEAETNEAKASLEEIIKGKMERVLLKAQK